MKLKILIVILLMGLCYYNVALIFSFETIYPEECEISFIGEIVKEKETKKYYDKYIIKVLKNVDISKSKNTKLILYVKSDIEYKVGDILKIDGNFEKAEKSRNYKGFNYRKYLKQNKIYGIVYSKEAQAITNKKDIYYIFANIRQKLELKIDELYNDNIYINKTYSDDIYNDKLYEDQLYKKEYSNFLKSILIGNKKVLKESIIEDFQGANISHVLAISGLHISLIIIGINFILDKIIKSIKIRKVLLIIFLIFFSNLTGNSLSCIRACIMCVLSIISSITYRKNNFYISFFISLIVIILLNPYNIFSVGLWLSYAGTLGIVILYNFIYKVLCFKVKLLNKKLKDNSKLFKFILKSISLSLSVQIFIFPITIYAFNYFSLKFLITNIVVSFFIGYIFAIGYISIFISFVFFPVAKFISYIEILLIQIVFYTVKVTSKLPLSQILVATPKLIFVFLYYVIFFYVVICFNKYKFKYLRFLIDTKRLKKKLSFISKMLIDFELMSLKLKIIKFKTFLFYNSKITIAIIIILIITTKPYIENEILNIHFIDVGQGDCTIIRTPSGKNIIIDGGEGNSEKYDYGRNVLFPYLLDRRIKKIDYIIISHADSDHIGGLMYILEKMDVKKVLIGRQPETSSQLEELIKIVDKKKIKMYILKNDDEIKIEKNVKIEVLCPFKDKYISENLLNNNSLVFKLKYNNFSILFTGDIEEIAEKEILNSYKNKLKSTIIKAPHHGSKSSSSQDFLEAVSPQIGLIGVGKNNKYGHPSKEVLERYEKSGIRIYRTDLNGEISIQVEEEGNYKVNCYLGE